jgi:hypothetical protein
MLAWKRALLLLVAIAVTAIGFVVWTIERNHEPAATGALAPGELPPNAPTPVSETALDAPSADTAADRATAAASTEPPAPVAPATPEAPILAIHVTSKSTHAPLAKIRVLVHDVNVERASWRNTESSHGSVKVAPRTDDHGDAEVEVPPDCELSLSAQSDNESTSSERRNVGGLKSGERREIAIELLDSDDLHFFGRVLDRGSRVPVAAARVERVTPRASSAHPVVTTTADDGRFEIQTASWNRSHLRIEAQGYALGLVVPEAEHNSGPTALEILLDRAASLTAHVLDASEAGIPDARVHLSTESYHISQPEGADMTARVSLSDPFWEGLTDSSGRCVLDSLPPGAPLHVAITPPHASVHKEPDPISLGAGEARTVEWRIGVGCRITGKVVDQDKRAADYVELWLMRGQEFGRYIDPYLEKDVVARATTDSEGNYHIDAAPSGKLWLVPKPTRLQWQPPSSRAIAAHADVIDVPDGMNELVHDLLVYRGLYIRGRVLDPSGQPVKDGFVNAFDNASWIGSQVERGGDGKFACGPLVPGSYRVSASDFHGAAGSDEVNASPGDDEVVLRLRAGGSLTGVVMDAQTREPCHATMIVMPRASKRFMFMMPESKSDGTFHVEGLDAGTYDLSATTENGRVGKLKGIEVVAGVDSKDLVLAVTIGARINVRYTGASKVANGTAYVDGVIVSTTHNSVQSVNPATLIVPAGHVRVDLGLYPSKRKIDKEIDVVAGEEKEIVFDDG